MSVATLVTFRAPVLAWAVSPDDEMPLPAHPAQRAGGHRDRLHRAAVAAGHAARPVAAAELPPRLARLMIEREATPPPPPPPPAAIKPDRAKAAPVETPSTAPLPVRQAAQRAGTEAVARARGAQPRRPTSRPVK